MALDGVKYLQTIVDNVPGGVFCCRYDEPLTLLHVTDGFLRMLGYAREELEREKRNSFRALFFPPDVEPTLSEVRMQLALGDTKEIEYRLVRRDGCVIWVLDKGQLMRDEAGGEIFYCILVDITRQKQAQEELNQTAQRMRILMEQTDDVIFEWDVSKWELTVSSMWTRKFGPAPALPRGDIRRIYTETLRVHPDDVARYGDAILTLEGVEPGAQWEMRIRDAQEKYIWCRIRATPQYDARGKPVKFIGLISDIDAEKRRTQRLIERAQRDALTGLYNRSAAQLMIEECLRDAGDGVHALMIMDLDDFKNINDTHGHLYGDAVLTDLAEALTRAFRATDVVARLGGDEFLIFLKQVQSSQRALERAGHALRAARKLLDGRKEASHLSCSIGVALYPQAGDGFNALYRHADAALYRAKRLGKDCCVLYDDGEKFIPAAQGRASAEAAGDSAARGDDFYRQAFQSLYEARDVAAAIQALLEAVGRRCEASRAYIFENSQDGRCMCNTFEWCEAGVSPQIDNLRAVPFAELGDYYANFNQDGVFYCQDVWRLPDGQRAVLSSQDIVSMLQCAILDDGKIVGMIGFDECGGRRYWTKDQVQDLTWTARLVSVFLTRLRAKERLAAERRRSGRDS